MNIFLLVGTTVLTICFSGLLFFLGSKLTKIQSMKAELNRYRKDPKNGTRMQKYFFGFAIMNGKIAEWTIQTLGDKFWSLWIRISGWIFIFFGIVFWLELLALWYFNIIL